MSVCVIGYVSLVLASAFQARPCLINSFSLPRTPWRVSESIRTRRIDPGRREARRAAVRPGVPIHHRLSCRSRSCHSARPTPRGSAVRPRWVCLCLGASVTDRRGGHCEVFYPHLCLRIRKGFQTRMACLYADPEREKLARRMPAGSLK